MNLVQTLKFLTNNNPSFATGDIVQTFYDSVLGLQVYKNNSLIGSGSSLTTGPVTNHAPSPPTYEYTNVATGYQFCTGTILTFFGFITTFPYVQTYTISDSPSCQAGPSHVCDLIVSVLPIITNPSTSTSSDGQINITATSSGSIKYSLTNDTYAAMTNTTGIFTGLTAGDYTVYILDQYGCPVQQAITLKAAFDYGVYYRMEYKNQVGTQSRIDILKRSWSGGITTLNTADVSPIICRLRGENSDKFVPILPSEADVNLMSLTDFQYQEFFTNYEHQYIVIWYKDWGSGLQEFWRGANMPGLYVEPFKVAPYAVTIQFTDQLALFSNYLFLDDNKQNFTGVQKVIQVIALLLRKTELNLPIRCGVNVFDVGMSTGGANDPLDQAYIDLDCFYDEDYTNPKDCKFVLEELLKPFGARLVQQYGYWWILEIDSLTATFNYRQFDINGIYVSNSTFSEIVSSDHATAANRIVWQDQGQTMEIVRSFGKLTISQTTDPKSSIVPNFGFEKPLVIANQIPDWALFINNTAESFQLINRNDSSNQQITVDVNPNIKVSSLKDLTLKIATSQALNIFPVNRTQSWPTPNTDYENAMIFSKTLLGITIDPLDDFEFGIDYYVDVEKGFGGLGPAYMMFRFKCNVGNWFLVDKTNNSGAANVGVLTSKSDLEAVVTTSLVVGTTTNFIESTTGSNYTYQLVAGTDAINDPLVLHPNDYNAISNQKVWKLIQFDNWVYTEELATAWNEVYVKDPSLGWNTKTITGQMPPVASTNELFQVIIMPMWYSPISFNATSLKAIPTTSKNPGFIFIGNIPGSNIGPGILDLVVYSDQYFQLVVPVADQDFTGSASGGNIIFSGPINDAQLPNDYDQKTNNVMWRFLTAIPQHMVSSADPSANRIFFFANGAIATFDNVVFKFKPKATDPSGAAHPQNFVTDPPKEQNFILTTSSAIKNEINNTCFLGDASLLINNASFIYRNFFTLSSGVATSSWTRSGISESNTLIAILCIRYLQQYSNPTWKLSGDFLTKYNSSGYKEQKVSFISTITQNSRNLIPYGMTIDDFNNKVNVELQEVIAKSAITVTQPFSGGFSQTAFGNGFDI